MKEIAADPKLVAKCGLYCGACSKYLSGKCPGCEHNDKATWCTVRTCNIERDQATCAECRTTTVQKCKPYNNFMAKLFGFIFRSDRPACITRIQQVGLEAFAKEMAEKRIPTIRR